MWNDDTVGNTQQNENIIGYIPFKVKWNISLWKQAFEKVDRGSVRCLEANNSWYVSPRFDLNVSIVILMLNAQGIFIHHHIQDLQIYWTFF